MGVFLIVAAALAILHMALQSHPSIAALKKRDLDKTTIWDVISGGRLPAKSFYMILTMQFVIAGV